MGSPGWRLVPGYLLKVRRASQDEFKKRTSGSLYQNVDMVIVQSLAENGRDFLHSTQLSGVFKVFKFEVRRNSVIRERHL